MDQAIETHAWEAKLIPGQRDKREWKAIRSNASERAKGSRQVERQKAAKVEPKKERYPFL